MPFWLKLVRRAQARCRSLETDMAALACVYLLTATCLVDGVLKERRYYGIFRIFANQTRESARQARERRHLEQPVAWLRSARPDTVTMRALGRPMDVSFALAEEAIQKAAALVDGGAPCRGGPWAHPRLGNKGLEEAGQVRRLVSRASTPSEARVAVLEYAKNLDDTSYLKRHCLDLPFNRDSAENLMGPRRRSG